VQVNPRTNRADRRRTANGNHRIIVFGRRQRQVQADVGRVRNKPVDDDHCEVVTPKEFPRETGRRNLSIVHGCGCQRRIVYVADRENRRVQSFTPDGKFLKQIVKTTRSSPATRVLADPTAVPLRRNGNDILIVDRKAMQMPAASSSGHDRRRPPHRTDSKGKYLHRRYDDGLQKLTFKGMSTAATN